ncbi:MAG: lytic transglycosylase domain-containing protein [Gaiellales bacterium]
MRRALGFILLALVALGAFGIYVVKAEPDWYLRMRYPLHYQSIIDAHADNYGLEPSLLAAVVYTESKFDPNAKSAAGAVGLMQLLPDTAQGIADHTGGGRYTAADLYDPELNIRYGSYYLARLQHKYRDHPQALDLALAAYNAGQGNVDRWVAETPAGAAVRIPFRETRDYLERVHRLQGIYHRAYGLR